MVALLSLEAFLCCFERNITSDSFVSLVFFFSFQSLSFSEFEEVSYLEWGAAGCHDGEGWCHAGPEAVELILNLSTHIGIHRIIAENHKRRKEREGMKLKILQRWEDQKGGLHEAVAGIERVGVAETWAGRVLNASASASWVGEAKAHLRALVKSCRRTQYGEEGERKKADQKHFLNFPHVVEERRREEKSKRRRRRSWIRSRPTSTLIIVLSQLNHIPIMDLKSAALFPLLTQTERLVPEFRVLQKGTRGASCVLDEELNPFFLFIFHVEREGEGEVKGLVFFCCGFLLIGEWRVFPEDN